MARRLRHQRDIHRWWLLPDEFDLLIIRPGRRKDFPCPEIVQQRVTADGTGLPR